MGECEGRVSGFVQALLMCADVLGLGLQVLASKRAQVCFVRRVFRSKTCF